MALLWVALQRCLDCVKPVLPKDARERLERKEAVEEGTSCGPPTDYRETLLRSWSARLLSRRGRSPNPREGYTAPTHLTLSPVAIWRPWGIFTDQLSIPAAFEPYRSAVLECVSWGGGDAGATFTKRNFTFGGFSLSSQPVFVYVRTEERLAILWRNADDPEGRANEIHKADIKSIDGVGGFAEETCMVLWMAGNGRRC
jgi:hypothetical protein